MSTKRLVVNADDLGLAESVNRGIIESVVDGVVTSTSLIVNMPACDDAIARLRSAPAHLSVGLHINVVCGRPLTPCATLLEPSGCFRPLAVLIGLALLGRLDVQEVEHEVEAQFDRAEELLAPLGRRVTHLDSHRHTHCLPGVYEMVLRVADRRGIRHVRHPYESSQPIPRLRARVASHILRAMTWRNRPIDDVAFAGVGAMRSMSFENDVLMLLDALPSGTTELMVHPGYDSPELAAIDSYRAPRERELRALTSTALRERIRHLGVHLTSFGATAPTEAPATAPAAEAS